jgi:flavorubredoxin
MAKAIADGVMSLKEVQAVLKIVDEVKTEELEGADAIILGSPTINSDIGSKMKAFLKKIADSQLQGKIGSAFGSYGWSGEAPGLLMDELKRFNMDLHYPIMRVKRQPSEFSLEECQTWGKTIAEEAARKKKP